MGGGKEQRQDGNATASGTGSSQLCQTRSTVRLAGLAKPEKYEGQPADFERFLAQLIVLAIVALFSLGAPALKATRIDPAAALKSE
jgi:hypothetical protein